MRRSVLALVMLSISPHPSFAKEVLKPASEARATMSLATVNALEKERKDGCVTSKLSGEYCMKVAAYLTAFYYGEGKYDKAATALKEYKAADARSGGNAPCIYGEFPDTMNERSSVKVFYKFEYYAALYAINHARQEKPYPYDFYAFLCQAFWETNNSLAKEGMGRVQFKNYVKRYYGDDSSYNVDLYLDDVNALVIAGYKKIRKGAKWGQDKRRDTEDNVKIAQLYRNAEKRVRDLGLAPIFSSFLQTWQRDTASAASRQARGGGLDR